jgi:hypothetical protein
MREIDGWGMTGYKKGERGICAFTGWLLESAKALFENNQCAFTGWLLESAKAHAKLDQCAFTRWLLESAKAHFEIGPMRFYPMAVVNGISLWANTHISMVSTSMPYMRYRYGQVRT